MPGLDHVLVLAVVAGAVLLFATEKLGVDLIALCVLLALLLLGLIGPDHAASGEQSHCRHDRGRGE